MLLARDSIDSNYELKDYIVAKMLSFYLLKNMKAILYLSKHLM